MSTPAGLAAARLPAVVLSQVTFQLNRWNSLKMHTEPERGDLWDSDTALTALLSVGVGSCKLSTDNKTELLPIVSKDGNTSEGQRC